jgi:hypothetical protein
MSISRLADVDLATFIAQSADPEALWLLLHIPKTAGTSLSVEMNELCRPYRNLHLSDDEYRRTDLQGRAFWAQLDRQVDALIADDGERRFRSASGHLLMPQAERIRAAIPRTRLVTFVRDPVARVVSDYCYQKTPLHPAHAAFAARFPRLADYVDTSDRNKMYQHLALRPDEPVDELVDRVAQTFAFVGAVELYAMSFWVQMQLAGVDALPKRRERATPRDTVEAELDDAMKARIAELNAADLAIFRHFRRILAARREEWTALRPVREGV